MTGQDNEPILRNLAALAADDALRRKVVMRMPLLRGVNDTPAVIGRTIDFYTAHGLEAVTLLPYHELGISKARHLGRDAQVFEPPSHERLLEIAALFRAAGMRAEILGEEISTRFTKEQ